MFFLSALAMFPDLYGQFEEKLGYLVSLTVTACLLLALFSWRYWRFTIVPFLHPELPKELPYWIPCRFRLTSVKQLTNKITIVLGWCHTSFYLQTHLF